MCLQIIRGFRGITPTVSASNIRPIGTACYGLSERMNYSEPTIGSLLDSCGLKWGWHGAGYSVYAADPNNRGKCYPNEFDATDNPFSFYGANMDVPAKNKDSKDLIVALGSTNCASALPSVAWVKALGKDSEHGGNPFTGQWHS